ncbi:response regulator transcription factor [Halomonas denitrificans]|uniref:response regulator n=1 Tax=Halomonas TaxID=2745 RepID=UPI001A8C8C1F|nr:MULTISPECIES: response regulator transcription factor [Halomonas]MBN8412989.1 response regulator transcription factor [Halomonas litopenaei]MBY5925305.1 response regulator transcription factor [Halomonas sp. DP4Y7-2]MBY5929123.1 response regulator transcription factor [Halomonas sp. DP8Y7-3]MBY5968212.1 response regulator transcription factor [Halomonas denitrificans]MBY5983705.1 response regulator transcription factor [Halomonas sp. DP5Y7-2]
MRALLVEDDPLLGDGIKVALEREGYAVDWFTQGSQALRAMACEPFSVMVLDLGLPDCDGVDLLRRLRLTSSLPVLILTARDAIEDRIQGLDAGADDYVLKPFDLQELLARLRVITRRAAGRASSTVDIGCLSIDEARHLVDWQGHQVTLSRREFALLSELARHPGQVLSRPRLEGLLYGWGEELESNALEVHVHHLRKKLHKEMITTVRGIGYRLNTDFLAPSP